MLTWEEHLGQINNDERANKCVDFRMVHVDMAGGDLLAGLMLSQIIYWYSPRKDGKSRLRVFKRGHYWIAKARYEWWNETRMSPKQADRALAKLKQLGLIEKRIFKFDGRPTVHLRLNKETYLCLWRQHTTLFEDRLSQLKRMPYNDYLETDEWKETRKRALQRADYKCQVCNGTHNLQVHHSSYDRRGNEADADLIVLCGACHRRFHKID